MKAVLSIINWYHQHRRDLPWRKTDNPYFIWLSEVILQQTRVEQGLPYYLKFIQKYPTLKKLASAKDDEVMKLWQGLGYYNRAKNMLNTARIIVNDLNGIFPLTYNDLIQLKGIGPYTAAAVASFAYNEPKAVVDGNVYRVLSRVFDITEPINSAVGKKIFAELAQDIMDKEEPGLYNQAIMELGATICKPTSPKCGECVLILQCLAFKHQKIGLLPVKLKKQKPKERYLHFFFIEQNEKTYIKQRKDERIWHNLFEPPFVETKNVTKPEVLFALPEVASILGKNPTKIKTLSIKHQLTHQTIFADFWSVKVLPQFKLNDKEYIAINKNDLKKYAVHRLFDKFIEFNQYSEDRKLKKMD